jgi:hypothetical protein
MWEKDYKGGFFFTLDPDGKRECEILWECFQNQKFEAVHFIKKCALKLAHQKIFTADQL